MGDVIQFRRRTKVPLRGILLRMAVNYTNELAGREVERVFDRMMAETKQLCPKTE